MDDIITIIGSIASDHDFRWMDKTFRSYFYPSSTEKKSELSIDFMAEVSSINYKTHTEIKGVAIVLAHGHRIPNKIEQSPSKLYTTSSGGTVVQLTYNIPPVLRWLILLPTEIPDVWKDVFVERWTNEKALMTYDERCRLKEICDFHVGLM